MMRRIVRVHFPDIDGDLVENGIAGLSTGCGRSRGSKSGRPPGSCIQLDRGTASPPFHPRQLSKGELPYLGVLFKKSQDYQRARDAFSRKRF